MLGCVYDIADYLTTDALSSPEGGFYSSEDADSLYRSNETEKREGAFYVWTRKEFETLLSEQEAAICVRFWNVKRHGNVAMKNDAMDEFTNQNVLAVQSTPSQLAKEYGLSEEEVVRIIKEARRKLWEHREKERPRPSLDDKIVTCWNGLAIGGLARASAALDEIDHERAKGYLEHAIRAAKFLREKMYDEASGRLKRVYHEGSGDVAGFADDYAFLVQGLIHLYEATFDESYLEWANRLQSEYLCRLSLSARKTDQTLRNTNLPLLGRHLLGLLLHRGRSFRSHPPSQRRDGQRRALSQRHQRPESVSTL